MKDDMKARLCLITSMFIFGTIGIFRTFIPISSGFLAFSRGLIGTIFLLMLMFVIRKKPSLAAIKANLLLLTLSGALIGFNWILLFESYKHTTVANATLCYYMAPIFVIAVSPLAFKERLTLKKTACVVVALVGMACISGVYDITSLKASELAGIMLGLGAALLYASVIVINKKLKDISAYDRTITQLASAGAVMFIYVLAVEREAFAMLNIKTVALLILVGIIHTGIAYALYFGSLEKLSAQTAAIFSYIDPVVAIILSTFLLHDEMGIYEWVGAVLILGATLVSEISFKAEKAIQQA